MSEITLKAIEIEELRLRNFKGVDEFDLSLDGRDAAIFGDNAAGKTTLVDAWCWLLDHKDSADRATFEIKTLDQDGEPIHKLDHEVSADLRVAGRRRTLRKVYAEKWTKRRGAADRTFEGHTTDHYVDGVPVTKTEYDEEVAGMIGDADALRLLTDPYHFAERLHWTDRRSLLLDVLGEVSDEEIVEANADLAELPEILDGRSPDKHRDVVNARRSEINKQLDRIPVRIDEANRSMPEVEGEEDEVRARLDDLRARRSEAADRLARIDAGGEAAELRKELAEVEGDRRRALDTAQEKIDDDLRKLRREHQDALDRKREARKAVERAEAAVEEAERDLEAARTGRDELKDQRRRINAEEFDAGEIEDECPTCGQDLPADEVEAAIEKARENFNSKKARKLEAVDEEMEERRESIERLESKADEARKALHSAEEERDEAESRAESTRAALDEAEEMLPDPGTAPEVVELSDKADRLESRIARLEIDSTDEREEAAARIEELDEEISEAESKLNRHRDRARAVERIEELEAEEEKLAAEFEELERQLFLLDEFVRAKVDLLTDRINSKFEIARFRLFEIQVNGALKEVCEVSVDGVPYSDLNHGARVVVGLDVIRTLQDHFGVALPVWVDQSESVTSIPEIPGQTIRLVVSEGDPDLRVEVEREEVAA